MTHLSVKTLRRHHESGLLEPAEVDDATGYRYYRPEQIAAAQMIHRLRELDMPVREIGELLSTPDPDRRADLVAGHLARLEAQLARTHTAVTSLRRLLAPDPEPLQVRRLVRPRAVVAAVRGTVARADVLGWYAGAAAELDAVLAAGGRVPTGPPGSLFDSALQTDDVGELAVYLPVGDPPRSGRIAPLVLHETELAVAVHRGEHSDIDVTYGELGRWVDRHALAIAGPVHETYLVGPRDTPDPSGWRTEIGWPVLAISPG
ncbi:MerR family transcriptional regulator [Pseudonocardia sp. KRD-291]|nr:MerR family transcriptional regulator [Pseudonocardia sp. KRD291]